MIVRAMTRCEFHTDRDGIEHGCSSEATRRVVFDMVLDDEEPRVAYLCEDCVAEYDAAVIEDLGPVDPRDIPEEDRSSVLNRFIPKINFPSDDLIGECWEWKEERASDSNGYGNFNMGDVIRKPHQFAWEWAYDIQAPTRDDPVELMHECSNPACANPAHLWRGSHAQNIQMAAESGGLRRKLADHADEIRERYEEEDVTQYDLAEEYDAHQSSISAIIRGEAYPEITG